MRSVNNIEINLDTIKEGLRLWIDSRSGDTLFDAENESEVNNEARFQLREGCFYDYQISDSGFILGDIGENIIQQHKRTSNIGTIAPNIFVGTLSIPLIEKEKNEEKGKIQLEVQSIKVGYRDDYREMLEFITEKCTNLLLHSNSSVFQHFEVDYSRDSINLYQKFAFIKSVVGTDDFAESIHRIITAPVTKWIEIPEVKDVRNSKGLTNANVKELLKGGKRTRLPELHLLRGIGIDSLPERINSIRKIDSVDTNENRFIKYALEIFLKFCSDIFEKAKKNGNKRLEAESGLIIRNLERQLQHQIFKEISRPTILNLNSPVLQRKEGYRNVFRTWLMFDLAARLIWTGGDDIYHGGKKDIATLYEYWLFFKLLELFQTIFNLEKEDISKLIEETPDGLNLQIKQGKFTALRGVFDSGSRKLNIQFNYNRSFAGKKSYPDSGSWTTTLRPDYTLSFWPVGISESEAEKQELIVHVHFDAKYRIANLASQFQTSSDSDLDLEKSESRRGIYKNADLLKMHAYKDAIRRTGGAYVLYPGDTSIYHKGFHEIIPGLGAFPVKPSKTDSGIRELKTFILEIIEHFNNRASQREKIAYRIFDVYKNQPNSATIVNEPLPEPYYNNRDLIPDETFVLVGEYETNDQYNWIVTYNSYFLKLVTDARLLTINKEVLNSKYLLLFSKSDMNSGKLWNITNIEPKVFSYADLEADGYTKGRSMPPGDYLLVKINPVEEPEFKNGSWNISQLLPPEYTELQIHPFSTTLAGLMRHKTFQ